MRTVTQDDLGKVAAKERARGRRQGRVDALLTVEAALGEAVADQVEAYIDANGWVLEAPDHPDPTVGG